MRPTEHEEAPTGRDEPTPGDCCSNVIAMAAPCACRCLVKVSCHDQVSRAPSTAEPVTAVNRFPLLNLIHGNISDIDSELVPVSSIDSNGETYSILILIKANAPELHYLDMPVYR